MISYFVSSFIINLTMSKSKMNKYQQIKKIPPLEPLQFIKNHQEFIQPPNQYKMWENIYFLMSFYQKGGAIPKNLLQQIIKRGVLIFQNQPNILYLTDPITIVGDIHGQFFDLIKHFENINLYSLIVLNNSKSDLKKRKTLFLGDYVDRGHFSVEVMVILLVLKIYHPKTFYLLRGNHESKIVTHIYNFKKQCLSKYDQEIYQQFIELFEALPLAAVVNGTFFCVHAGISEQLEFLNDINKIKRFKQVPIKGLMSDMLWSDPSTRPDGSIAGNKLSQFNDNRLCSIRYGRKLLSQFLRKNQLLCMIRAHQCQEQGYSFIYWQGQTQFPSVITLFSAPNYCGGINKGAVASIDKNIINIFPQQKLPQPFVLPDFIGAFQISIPHIIAEVTQIFFYLLKLDDSQLEQDRISSFSDKKIGRITQNNDKFKQNSKQNKISENKHKKEQQIQDVELKILKKQQILFQVYQNAKQYIINNINYAQNNTESASKKGKRRTNQFKQ